MNIHFIITKIFLKILVAVYIFNRLAPKSVIVLCLLFSMVSAYGQGEYALGEKDFTLDKEETTVFTSYNQKDYPQLKDSIDLSYLMPPAGNQGTKGSCWAWATTYELRSVMDNSKSYTTGGELNTNNVYSPEYVYQYYKGNISDCKWGAYSYDMLDKILKDGVVKYSDFTYNENACNNQPTRDIIDKAKKFAKRGYKVEKLDDLYSIEKVLSDHQPVLISIKVDDYFCRKGNITKASPYWNTFQTRKGSHAMVIVGYNNRRNAVKVLNSWGKEFGDDGYVWISYTIINSAMNYACYPKKELDELPITKNSTEQKSDSSDENVASFKRDTSFINGAEVSLTTWFKEGYFRPYENLKIVLADLNKSKKFAVIEIRDEDYVLITNFYIELKSSKEFYVNKLKYTFTFDDIARAGNNPFNKAVYFTISHSTL